ncbi:hypothetical protein QFZ97_007868 [Paraburkholderia youngii]
MIGASFHEEKWHYFIYPLVLFILGVGRLDRAAASVSRLSANRRHVFLPSRVDNRFETAIN